MNGVIAMIARFLFAALVLSLSATCSRAELITIDFTGVVDNLNLSASQTAFATGTTIAGRYVYDRTTPGVGSPLVANFNAFRSVNVAIGTTHTITSTDASRILASNFLFPPAGSIGYRFESVRTATPSSTLSGTLLGGRSIFAFRSELIDIFPVASPPLYTSALDLLPVSFDLSRTDSERFSIEYGEPSPSNVGLRLSTGVITSFNASVVPAPAAWVLMGVALVATRLRLRRRES
jgi:hypothetical protein